MASGLVSASEALPGNWASHPCPHHQLGEPPLDGWLSHPDLRLMTSKSKGKCSSWLPKPQNFNGQKTACFCFLFWGARGPRPRERGPTYGEIKNARPCSCILCVSVCVFGACILRTGRVLRGYCGSRVCITARITMCILYNAIHGYKRGSKSRPCVLYSSACISLRILLCVS